MPYIKTVMELTSVLLGPLRGYIYDQSFTFDASRSHHEGVDRQLPLSRTSSVLSLPTLFGRECHEIPKRIPMYIVPHHEFME